MISISNTEMSTFLRCPRQWYLRYYLGLKVAEESPVGNAPLGIRIHAALEGYYGYDLDPLAVLVALYAAAIREQPEYEAELAAERDLALAMVEGYLEWVTAGGQDASLHVVATEADVRVPLPGVEGVELRARLDQAVWDDQSGLVKFMDHKSAASFDTHELLVLHPQFRVYSLIQRLARPDRDDVPKVSGGIINTLRRVKRTERSKPPYYQRDSFRYSDEMIDATLLKAQRVARQILDARRALDWIVQTGQPLEALNETQRYSVPPIPNLHECSWQCPFVQLCPMMDDGSDWAGAAFGSGRYIQADPYAYYDRDLLAIARAELAKP